MITRHAKSPRVMPHLRNPYGCAECEQARPDCAPTKSLDEPDGDTDMDRRRQSTDDCEPGDPTEAHHQIHAFRASITLFVLALAKIRPREAERDARRDVHSRMLP